MTIAEFVRQHIYSGRTVEALNALEACAGHEFGHATFDRTMAEAFERIEPWMPLFFLPIGEFGGFHAGVHLRPSDVAAGRVAVLQVEDSSSAVEIAASPAHLAFLGLARTEGEAGGENLPASLQAQIKDANQLLGADFYKPGSYGEFTDEEAQEVTAREKGPSVESFLSPALMEDDPARKLDLLEKGMKLEPGCMAFYTNAVEVHKDRDEDLQAARRMAQSLACFHHTGYAEDFDAYYSIGRNLLGAFPNEFSAVNVTDLQAEGDKARLTWVTELYTKGEVELATKVLCDLCHTLEDYDSVLHLFQRHFEKLGWAWGEAMCRFRRGELT